MVLERVARAFGRVRLAGAKALNAVDRERAKILEENRKVNAQIKKARRMGLSKSEIKQLENKKRRLKRDFSIAKKRAAKITKRIASNIVENVNRENKQHAKELKRKYSRRKKK